MTRVAIVTGAAQGLAKDGNDVAINDVSSNLEALDSLAEEIKAIGRNSITLIADVSKESEVISAVQKTVEALGTLDIMVANAGINLPQSLLDGECCGQPG
ncbi:hypothetical protein FRC12_000316 [Ceratobasidium sp. 428]|nr:hypothetical protein FRC12_000316 [Ceratobasidium sp. 428]